MRQAALIAGALLLSGCGTPTFGSRAPVQGPPAGLRLAIEPSTAWAGTTATLSIYNGSSEPVGYNLCTGGLEQRRGPLWIPALTLSKACPATFATLAPGERATAETPLAAPLESGAYRYVTRVQVPLTGLPETQLRSDPITISQTGG